MWLLNNNIYNLFVVSSYTVQCTRQRKGGGGRERGRGGRKKEREREREKERREREREGGGRIRNLISCSSDCNLLNRCIKLHSVFAVLHLSSSSLPVHWFWIVPI